jgi:rubrerythrin
MWNKSKAISEATLKAAIRKAIQTEKDARDYYLHASERMTEERARLTFNILASEELEHARSFYDLYEWADLESFKEMMDGPPNVHSEWWSAIEQTKLADFDEQRALRLAIEREGNLEKKLRSIAEKISDAKAREVFMSNARLTHRHCNVVKGDYEALTGGGGQI